MAIPFTEWNETIPENTEAFSLGDDRIRELKTQIRDLISVDHYMPTSSGQSSDWGRHNMVTLLEQTSNPDTVSTTYILFTKEVATKSELHIKTPAGTVHQLTSLGKWIGGMTKEIRMWSGTLANIPYEWYLCDGTGGRPNLVAKFLMGIHTSTSAPGTTGGSDTHVISIGEMASHNHTTATDGIHSHSIRVTLAIGGGILTIRPGLAGEWVSGITSNPLHQHFDLNATGSGTSFNTRPSYYELAFICR